MDENKRIEKRTAEFKKKGLRKRLITLLSLMVVISTSYIMIQPGQALDLNPAKFFMFLEEGEEGEVLETAPDTEDPELYENEITEPEETVVAEEPSGEEETAAVEEQTEEEIAEEQPSENVAATEEGQTSEEETAVVEEPAEGEPELTEETPVASEEVATAEDDEEDPLAVKLAEEETPAEEGEEEAEQAEILSDWSFEETTDKEDGEEITVYVTAPAEAFPKGTVMKVKRVTLDKEEMKAVEDKVEGEVKQVHAVDISFWNKDANGEDVEIEPAEGCAISVKMKSKVIQELAADSKEIVHIDDEKNAELVEQAKPEKSEALEDDEMAFETDKFSVYAIIETEIITEFTISNPDGEDVTYLVSVTYDNNANIPEGSTLKVTEIGQESEEYEYARNSVLADKKEKGEFVDIDSFNLAALDISIIGPDGQEIEPEDTVTVDIKIKSLPGVENLEEIKDTLEIQHHVEVADGVVIEKVFDGSEEGSYEMETDENIAAKGTVVDPASVSDDDFRAEETAGEEISAVFTTFSFSTFTVSWSNATNTSTNIRWRYGNNNTRGQVTVNYVGSDDLPITRPSGINGNYDISVTNGDFSNEVVFSSDNVARVISGRTYQSAYIMLNGVKTEITRVVAARTTTGGGWQQTTTYSMSYYDGDELVYSNSGTGSTNFTRPDVYLQYSGTSGASTVTVHYVDEDGNELTIKNPAATYQNLTSSSSSPAYLIYDIDGYEYSYTYRNTDTNTNRIRPRLQKNGSVWQYAGANSNTYNNLTDGDDIYVVYKPKATPTQGGTPELDEDETWPDEDDPAIKPTFSKSSTNQGDGTNLISLSIKGAEKPVVQATPADVIVVFDNSYSMSFYNMSGGTSGTKRLQLAKDAVNNMADTLLNGANTDVRIALVSFGTDAEVEQEFTDNYDTFSGKVNALTGPSSERTNWEKGLYLANTSNQLEIRDTAATFVVFITDGDPTVRMSRGDLTNEELRSHGMSDSYYNGSYLFGDGNMNETNYEDCYNPSVPRVQEIVGSNKSFYAIGVSSDVSRLEQLMTDAGQSAENAFPCTDEDGLAEAFAAITQSIQSALGFGDVEITDGITALTNMQLKKSMQTVDETSFKYYRWGGKKETTVDGETVITNDKYGADEAHKSEWTTREADGCDSAIYNHETGCVEWNMGDGFQLEDGVTYIVSFRVWPSQDAYDTIANLNNGTETYSTLDPTIKAQIEELQAPDPEHNIPGSYTLKTNTDTLNATYKKTTKTGGVVSVSDETENDAEFVEGTIQNMSLASDKMTLKKEWAHEFNDSHAGDQVKFYLKVDDDGYYQNDGTVKPSETNADSLVLGNPDWQESIFIAPGMMDYVDGEVNLLETGHEYELYEYEITQDGDTDNYIASYDFISQIVRPMYVNGTLKYLVKYTSASEIPEGVTETYTIDGKTYYVRSGSGTNGLLSGTNYRRAELDITKIINKGTSSLTEEQLNKEVFTYRVTLRMPSDADLSLITGWQFVYNPDNPNWTIQGYQEEDEPLEGDETRFAGYNFRWGTFTYNGTAIGSAVVPDDIDPENYVKIVMDLSMYPNQVVRLTNLPMGTKYEIEEVYANLNTLTGTGLMRDANVVPSSAESNLASQGYTSITSQSKYGSGGGTVISGTINNPNRRYYNQFTNTIDNMAAVDLQVTKHLDGYSWSDERYYFSLAAGEHKDADENVTGTSPLPASTTLFLNNASGSDDRSYGFGTVKFTEEGTYTYTVKEYRYRPGGSTTIVDIIDDEETIPGTEIIFDKPVTITVTVSKDQNGSLYVASVDGTRTELNGTVINTTFNNRIPCKVKILKVGDSTKPLENVEFTVYSDEELTIPVTTDATGQNVGTNGVITTDEDGYALLGTMVSNTSYYLKETASADGYNILNSPVVVTYNGTTVTASCEQDGVVFNNPEWIYKDNEGYWVVKINNTSGAVLPNAGGPGTLLYTLGGLTLMLSALMYGFRMRRRERRLNE